MISFSSYRSYWNFQKTVIQNERYIRSTETQEFLDAVLSTCQERYADIPAGYLLWRSQLGHNWRVTEQDGVEFEDVCPHPSERMKPRKNRASDGRANSQGIPVLYLATKEETAIAEARPWIGSYVSVGQFKTRRPLRVIDFSKDDEVSGTPLFFDVDAGFYEPSAEEREKAVWSEIGRAFSKPVTRNDEDNDYVPTQILTELFKANGADGIAYRSNFGEDGFNVALFDIDSAELVNCALHQVHDIGVETSVQGNPYFTSKKPE